MTKSKSWNQPLPLKVIFTYKKMQTSEISKVDLKRLKDLFTKAKERIASNLEDFYETAKELEQELDLFSLKSETLNNGKTIVPRIGFLAQYDFEHDEHLQVVSQGILKMKKFSNHDELKNSLAGARIAVIPDDDEEDESNKMEYVKLPHQVFIPDFENEELEDYIEAGELSLPVVIVTVMMKPFVSSDSDESDDSSETDSEELEETTTSLEGSKTPSAH